MGGKPAENNLGGREQQLTNIINCASEVIYTLSPEGVFTFVSPAWSKRLGHDVSEVEGRNFASFVHPEDLPQCQVLLKRVLQSGHSQKNVEFRVRHKNGSWRWYKSNGSTIKDEQGRAVEYVGIAEDVTEHKEREEEARRSRKVLQDILENLPCGVAVIGRDKNIRHINKAALSMAGYDSESELLGRACHQTLCPAEVGKCPILDLGQRIDNTERKIRTRDGKSLPILKTVIPVVLDAEEVLLEVFVDLTERKRAEEELKEYSIALELANRSLEQLVLESQSATKAKSEFLANMSHEIRTPMTSILGFADILLANAKNADDIDAVEIIRRNGEYLLRIINDILDLSKIEAGRLALDRTACSVFAIVAEVVSLMRVRGGKEPGHGNRVCKPDPRCDSDGSAAIAADTRQPLEQRH